MIDLTSLVNADNTAVANTTALNAVLGKPEQYILPRGLIRIAEPITNLPVGSELIGQSAAHAGAGGTELIYDGDGYTIDVEGNNGNAWHFGHISKLRISCNKRSSGIRIKSMGELSSVSDIMIRDAKEYGYCIGPNASAPAYLERVSAMRCGLGHTLLSGSGVISINSPSGDDNHCLVRVAKSAHLTIKDMKVEGVYDEIVDVQWEDSCITVLGGNLNSLKGNINPLIVRTKHQDRIAIIGLRQSGFTELFEGTPSPKYIFHYA